MGVGERDKGCSQKTGLDGVESEPHVGGCRVRNVCRCLLNPTYMGIHRKKMKIGMYQNKGELLGADNLW